MSLSPKRSKSVLSYLAVASSRPTRTASSSSIRKPSSERPQSNSDGTGDVRPYQTYTSRMVDESKCHRRHKSSRSLDHRLSYRSDHQSHQPASKHQHQGSYFEDSDSDSHKQKSFFSRTASLADSRRHSHKSQAEKGNIDSQSPLESPKHREPTLADAKKHHIAPGRCLKHWDPDEEPILLLTSVFDAFSLGEWVLDQTARIYGEQDEMKDLAAEFRFEHMELGKKTKLVKNHLQQIADPSIRKKVKEFITSGDQLVNELGEILKRCEQRVLKKTGINEIPKLGHESVVVFIDTFIGRNTAQINAFRGFTRSMREWNARFDADCTKLLV